MSDQIDSAQARVDGNFVEIISILERNRIPYWACHGTLLGLARDGELIPWDHDIDIAVWADSVSKHLIRDLMASCNYVQKESDSGHDLETFRKPGGRDVDFNFYKKSPTDDLAFVEWVIPKSVFSRAVRALARGKAHNGRYRTVIRSLAFLSPGFKLIEAMLRRHKLLYRVAGYTSPASLLANSSHIEYHGVPVKVPEQFELVLQYLYGADWRTPKRKYDWVSDSPATRVLKASI